MKLALVRSYAAKAEHTAPAHHLAGLKFLEMVIAHPRGTQSFPPLHETLMGI
jgi:hypothetical protein